jgi:hypothetical protein
MALKQRIRSVAKSVKEGNERGARTSLIEELFYDFNRSRSQVYVMNFVRGILFGAGSVLGGTVVIALLIWILSLLGNVVPPLGDFFDGITTTIESGVKD